MLEKSIPNADCLATTTYVSVHVPICTYMIMRAVSAALTVSHSSVNFDFSPFCKHTFPYSHSPSSNFPSAALLALIALSL